MRISFNLLVVCILMVLTLAVNAGDCVASSCLSCPTNPNICESCQAGQQCCQEQCLECSNQTQCTLCEYGYELNTTTSLCQMSESCYQYGCNGCNNDICSSCLSGFAYNNQTYECIMCPMRCQICSLNNECIRCSLGNYLNEYGQCQGCYMPNCLTCLNNVTCTLCGPGYYISNQTCSTCPNNCQYCTNSTTCSVCSAGYYMTSSQKCKQCASSCTNCTGSANNCTQCNSDSYMLQSQCFKCYTAIPFCVSCQIVGTQLQCMNCAAGMFVTQANTCGMCPQGCLTCSNSSACSNCTQGYYLSNNSLCLSCNISNCNVCLNNQTCTTCNYQFYPGPGYGSCLPCMPNCGRCKSATTCSTCLNGYYFSNGACQPCYLNCVLCKGINNCFVCVSGFYFYVSTLTGSSYCLPCPSYCPNCHQPSNCNYCNPGYYLVNNSICLSCPTNNCYNCNTTNSQSQQVCSRCYNGYFLSSDASCVSCQPNCLICTNSSSCQLCMSGYFSNSGICSPCLANCSTCNSAQYCSQCFDGYYMLNNGTLCSQCPAGCTECYSSSACRTCQSGYYLNSPSSSVSPSLPVCMKCPSTCLTCLDSSACTFCKLKYRLQADGTCVSCPDNFLVCVKEMGLQCIEGFALQYNNNSTSCEKCPTNCHRCIPTINTTTNTTSLKCTQCNFGFTLLQDGSCFQCGSNNITEGCQVCNNLGLCQTCFTGFIIDNNKQCYSVNYSDSSSWTEIIVCICLGCIAMVLVIFVLYQRYQKPNRPSSFRVQLTQERRQTTL